MARELKPVDISEAPDILRLAEEVARSGESRVLRRGNHDLAVISPVDSTSEGTPRGQAETEDDPLWEIVGLAEAADFPDAPRDVATNKHTYLAETYDERR